MSEHRTEHDGIGPVDVPRDALHGIHTERAIANFPLARRPVQPGLVHAYGAVKLACLRANHEISPWPADVHHALESAATEMVEGRLDAHVVVDALQGGAGTSTNMNVNEVIANRALVLLGRSPGEYGTIDPIADVNRHQSTNDTFPTALRVSAIRGLRGLEREIVRLLEAFQDRERALQDVVKVGRTQLQDAVLTTLGRSMASYADAFARDRWRVYKCEERLRVVPLGGTAIGTGLGAPRQYIFRAVEHLREITGLGLARAENPIEATQNADAFVEVSGILRALATSLLKVSNDLRLLASGPDAGLGELLLPPRQAGSSIMPGKVNPVIPEAVGQCAILVSGHDQALTLACGMGQLELNAFLPLVAESLLESIRLLTAACRVFATRCVEGLDAQRDRCRRQVENAAAAATAVASRVGYVRARELVQRARDAGRSVRDVTIEDGALTAAEYDELISPEAVTRLGSPSSPTPAPASKPAREADERPGQETDDR